jgi:hypothetical protein
MLDMWTAILSIAALVVAGGAVVYARRSADAANRSAIAAEAAERRERTPKLRFLLDHPVEAPIEDVIYRLRNEGPQDLDDVILYRPKPPDGIKYPIAVTGAGVGWADDEIQLGPLALTKEARFTFCCSAAEELPEFLVRVECTSGDDAWTVSAVLPSPRPVRDPLGPDPAATRSALDGARAAFQDLVSRGGDDKSFFEDPQRKFIGQQLRDSADRTGRKRPKDAILAVAATWDTAFATAPPDRGPQVINLNDIRPDPDEPQRHAVGDIAQDGLERASTALALVNAEEGLAGAS